MSWIARWNERRSKKKVMGENGTDVQKVTREDVTPNELIHDERMKETESKEALGFEVIDINENEVEFSSAPVKSKTKKAKKEGEE